MTLNPSDSDFNGGKAGGDLGNLFAVGQPVFYVQPDGIFDVVDSFFVRFTLAVATVGGGQETKKPSASASMTIGRVMFFMTSASIRRSWGMTKQNVWKSAKSVARLEQEDQMHQAALARNMPRRSTGSTKSATSDFIPGFVSRRPGGFKNSGRGF